MEGIAKTFGIAIGSVEEQHSLDKIGTTHGLKSGNFNHRRLVYMGERFDVCLFSYSCVCG